jgi:hypothetical protein
MSHSPQDQPLDPKPVPSPTGPDASTPAIALAHYLTPEMQQMVESARARADSQSPQPQTRLTLWQRWEDWLSAQDSLAVAIASSLLLLLLGFGSYILMASSLHQGTAPSPSHPVSP